MMTTTMMIVLFSTDPQLALARGRVFGSRVGAHGGAAGGAPGGFLAIVDKGRIRRSGLYLANR